ncbi:MAG: hypothetical protein JWM98_3363 [Thermoleophilia bacterium]|nr:hypothetical protein [Thermoleophilia bacterium]
MQLATIVTRNAATPPSAPTVEHGRELLVKAQGAAADASNAPADATYASLMQGARAANSAAAELRAATPRSKFQDLDTAATQAEAGAKLLGQAAFVIDAGEFSGPTIVATVKDLAHQAFDQFEAAFEIVDND